MQPTDGVVYRGLAFTPSTPLPNVLPEAPWVPLIPLSALGIPGYVVWRRRRRALPVA